MTDAEILEVRHIQRSNQVLAVQNAEMQIHIAKMNIERIDAEIAAIRARLEPTLKVVE